MSAPTPKWSDDHTLAVIAGDLATEWPATPADVRLWLLDNGAVERRWCETHDAESIENHGGETDECWRVVWVDTQDESGNSVGPHYSLCRMVSVLVYKEEK